MVFGFSRGEEMSEGDKKAILAFLRSKHIMQLATCSGLFMSKPWICTVNYYVDDDLSLYFLSDDETRHCKEIRNNNRVACAIADSRQKVTDAKKGVQLEGVASVVKDKDKIGNILAGWNRANPGIEHIISYAEWRAGTIGNFYKIKPTMIKLFDEALNGIEQKMFRLG